MTQENRNLLLKDLCGRLPYGVKVNHLLDTKPSDLFAIDTYRSTLYCFRNGREEWYKVEFIEPYLRPMSSMTDEEKEELVSKHIKLVFEDKNHNPETVAVDIDGFDWLNAHHFDYRGLIEKGLALEAPEGMYNS